MMKKLIRFKKYLQWQSLEIFSKKSVSEIYNHLSEDIYDYTIDFESRRAVFESVLLHDDFYNKKVLDLACGTGVTIDVISKYQPKKVVAVDISQGMLKKAQERFSELDNIQFYVKSFMHLDELKLQEKYDSIVLFNACRFIAFDHEQEFFTSMRDLLSEDGKFFILSDYIFSPRALGKIVERWVKRGLNKEKVNINTVYEEGLLEQLQHVFSIEEVRPLGQENFFCGHNLFICSKK